jgi:hypothetical protein
VTNRTILEGLKKKVEENKSEWPDLLDEILWTYRTSPRETTQQSSYSLVYGMDVVTPMELILPSLRTTNYNIDSNREERSCELEFVDKAREQARTRMMNINGVIGRPSTSM